MSSCGSVVVHLTSERKVMDLISICSSVFSEFFVSTYYLFVRKKLVIFFKICLLFLQKGKQIIVSTILHFIIFTAWMTWILDEV